MLYLSRTFAASTIEFSDWLVAAGVFLLGLCLLFHGAFSGIEAAVAAGTERSGANAER
ncbi:hypothetical protein [Halosolutus gelatinilyticus]|uniref:hypothetical protein n=1 Tax=Halosolutus gelatinilyticus TaxID=2931975 RepID=UPI001FF51CE1|nr:hypothetical protein [Halosolutus gelatinilyticus]